MASIGEDFAGGQAPALRSINPAGLVVRGHFAVALVVLNQLLQSGFGMAAATLDVRPDGWRPGQHHQRLSHRHLSGVVAHGRCRMVNLARFRGGAPARFSTCVCRSLGWLGGRLPLVGFLLGMYAHADRARSWCWASMLRNISRRRDRTIPESIGLVKQAMFDIAHDPKPIHAGFTVGGSGRAAGRRVHFSRPVVYGAVADQARYLWARRPLRRLAWALLHLTEPWFSVGSSLSWGWLSAISCGASAACGSPLSATPCGTGFTR